MPKNKKTITAVNITTKSGIKTKQVIKLDTEDQFLIIFHEKQELAISVENWTSLNDLVNRTLQLQKTTEP